MIYGKLPIYLGQHDFSLREVMYYLYLPVKMGSSRVLLPQNVEGCRQLIQHAIEWTAGQYGYYHYIYLSARKGWATPDNPLNRPGWHADGFGTDDLNFVWWEGPSTRFAIQRFTDISDSHTASLVQFNAQLHTDSIVTYPEHGLYALDPSVVHATPVIPAAGCMRQYIKISMSDHRYNLENNSHNYLFDYDWPLTSRETARNDTHTAQQDYVS